MTGKIIKHESSPCSSFDVVQFELSSVETLALEKALALIKSYEDAAMRVAKRDRRKADMTSVRSNTKNGSMYVTIDQCSIG